MPRVQACGSKRANHHLRRYMRRVGSRWVPVDDAFPGHTLGELFDAILYLGLDKKLRTIEVKEPADQPYASELKRLRAIVMGTP